MELLRFEDLECRYGAREIFAGLGGVLRDGERCVGRTSPLFQAVGKVDRNVWMSTGVTTGLVSTVVRATLSWSSC
ncbi:MAG: hypothetical protein HKL92_01365 [Candidatus Eremiobacteraeota bacterium]|nr:hypothetical protein [Candidatus Eremiobacteraeota bacterium]